MIEETVLAEQDPAERSHEVVERELERQDGILAEGNGQTLQSADQATFVRAKPPRTVRQPNYQFCGRRYPIRQGTCQRLAF